MDEIRRHRSEVENNLIDELKAGRVTRREFMRRGTVLGMSIPLLSFIATACGDDGGSATSAPSGTGGASAKPGGTLRIALIAPASGVDPYTVGDEGGAAVLSQSAEYLSFSNAKLELEPRLAESWSPNDDGSEWTFKIRQGATFNDGTPFTANDVVATVEANLAAESNALSSIGGVVSKGNTEATDDTTVVFKLDAPNGGFPYLVSSDNYNLIILPASYDGKWDKSFIGTGPWVMESYTPDVGATYVKNSDYWDATRMPLADRTEVKFYPDEQGQVLALQSGDVDIVVSFSVANGQSLLTDPNVTTLEQPSSSHRVIHMRNDKEPFTDKRVRQAIALLIDRQALVEGLFDGKADLGNDSPFAPLYPFTNTDVAQRTTDVEQAKQLLADAGLSDGFEVQLDSWQGFEIPDLAVLVQNAASEANINIKLNITDAGSYYGTYTYGSSDWLDSTFGITDWGHRGVPNVFLASALGSKGPWNAAHFKNTTFDGLVADYIAALDTSSQQDLAGQIQELLLDETPSIIPYFYYYLTGFSSQVTGVRTTPMGHFDVTQAGFVA